MIKKIRELMFPRLDLQVSGKVAGSSIKIEVFTKNDEPRFNEIKTTLEKLEEEIAYPEIRFVIRRLD